MSEKILVSESIVANLKFNEFFDQQKVTPKQVDGLIAEDIEFGDYYVRFILKRVSDGTLFAGPWTRGRFNEGAEQSDEVNIECVPVTRENNGDFEDFFVEY